jgi:UDP-2,3-diacylglucosamine hydrolase
VADPSYKALMGFFDRLQYFDDRIRPVGETPCAGEEREEVAVTDLFLVGDVFDHWFSRNGRVYPDYEPVIERLRVLKRQGVAIHLFEGNHDFSLAGYFADYLGMNVYPDWACIERSGGKLYVAHGDLVDESNRSYLRLRRFLRSSFAYRLQRLMPLPLLWAVARWSSAASLGARGEGDGGIYEKMERFALDRFREGYDAVVLGHSHAARLTAFEVQGRQRHFAALGDWVQHMTYLYYDEGRFFLRRHEKWMFRLDKTGNCVKQGHNIWVIFHDFCGIDPE